jgi:uronate dehydrogenase
MKKAIVLTGAAGRLGRQLRPSLAAACEELRLIDQAPIDISHAGEVAFQMDLADTAQLASAMQGASAVVHFAGYPREAGWDVLLPANIVGAINLWEAARLAGVERIVYASSNHAVGMYPRSTRLTNQALPNPDSRYGLTKVFMESLAAMYWHKHGVRGFGIRIGHCAPEPTDARMLSHWVHPEDLASLVRLGLEAEYENEWVYGVSANSRSWWNDVRAVELGYRPRHSADRYIAALEDKVSDSRIAEHFQGGSFAAADYTARALN